LSLDLAVIQEVVIDDSKSAAAAQRVVATQEKMQAAADKTAAATERQAKGLGMLDAAVLKSGTAQESALRRLNVWKAAADDNERVMQRLARAEADLDRARKQGLISQDQQIKLLGQLETKMRGVAAANDNLTGQMRVLNAAVSVLPGSIGNVANRVVNLSAGFGVVSAGATAAAVAIGAAGAALLTLARGQDQLTMIEARLKNVAGSASAASDALRPLFEGSQRTGTNFNDTIGAFQRLGLAARDMGAAQEDVVKLTLAVQQLGRLGGGSTQELQAGMQQFGQALASGRLQGDELRSILENMPLLARAIADGLGVSVGQLREMGAAGELTSTRVFKAILGQTDDIASKFAGLPQTVDMGLTRVGNAWDLAIGRMGKRIEANKPLMLLLNALSGGLESIAEGLDDSVMARASRLERAANDPGRAVGTDAAGKVIRDRSAANRSRQQLADMGPELIDDAFVRTVEAAKAANENIERQVKATEDLRKKVGEVSAEYQRQTEIQSLGEEAVKRVEAREKAVAAVLKAAGVDSLEAINSLSQERADIILLAATRAGDEAEQMVRVEQGIKTAEKAEKQRLQAAKAQADELNRWLDLQTEALKGEGERIKLETERERVQMAANDNLEDYIGKLEAAATVDGRTTLEKKTQEAIIEAQNRLYDKQGEKIRDLDQVEQDRITTAIRQTDELEKQRKKIEEQEREVERVAQRAEDQLSDALGDGFFDYLTGKAGNFWQTVKEMGLRAFADLAASNVVSAVFGGPIRSATNWLMGATPMGGGVRPGLPGGMGAQPGGGFGGLSDLFSLGSSGYQMATGNSIWSGLGNWLGLGGAVAGSGAAIGWGGLSAATLASAEAAGLGATVTGGYGALAGGAGAPVAAGLPWAGALGAAGLGFAGGALLAQLMGGNAVGGGIGGGLGAGAGFLIGGPVGAIIGGLGGSLLGGMFGGGKKKYAGGHTNVDVTTDGLLSVGATGARGVDPNVTIQQAQQLVQQVNALLQAYDLRATRGIAIGQGQATHVPQSVEEAIAQLIGSRSFTSDDPVFAKILEKTGASNLQGLAGDLDFGKFYKQTVELQRAANATRDAFEELTKSFDDNIEKVKKFDLSVEDFTKGAAANFNQEIERGIKGITDPVGLAIADFAEIEEARLEYAKKIGADIAQVEKLNMLERMQILQQGGADLNAWLKGQVLGPTSGLTGSGRLAEAQSQFGDAVSAARAGTGGIGDVTRLADIILAFSSELYGGTKQAAFIEQTVRSTIETLGRDLGLPGFAEGGYHDAGLRIVGERGWEIEATGPARYWNQQQIGAALAANRAGATSADIGEVAVLLQRQLNEVAAQRKDQQQLAAELRKFGQLVDMLLNTQLTPGKQQKRAG